MSNKNNCFQMNEEKIKNSTMYRDSTRYADSEDSYDNISCKQPSTVVNLDELSVGDKSDSKREKYGNDKRLFIHFCR